MKEVYQYVTEKRYDLTTVDLFLYAFLQIFNTKVVVIYADREKKTQLLVQSLQKQYTSSSVKIISIFLSEEVQRHWQALENAKNLQHVKINIKGNATLQIMKFPYMKGGDYIFYLFTIIFSPTVLHRINAQDVH